MAHFDVLKKYILKMCCSVNQIDNLKSSNIMQSWTVTGNMYGVLIIWELCLFLLRFSAIARFTYGSEQGCGGRINVSDSTSVQIQRYKWLSSLGLKFSMQKSLVDCHTWRLCVLQKDRGWRLIKGKFHAYVLWPLAKKFQNWIVDRSTHVFTV